MWSKDFVPSLTTAMMYGLLCYNKILVSRQHTEREREETQRLTEERENANLKTLLLIYKECSLGSVKNLSNN